MATRILFVCMGNICRSPTAEGVFRARVAARGVERDFEIDSAGTHAYHVGDPPDPRSIEAAARRDIDLSIVTGHAQYVVCLNRSVQCQGATVETLTADNLKQLYQHDAGLYAHTGSHEGHAHAHGQACDHGER
jgi:protein-tyrosine-phosphatase